MTDALERPLTQDEFVALRQSCNPIGVLAFPPADVVMALRQLDYVEIVLGGVQITSLGLTRLTSENARRKRC